MYDLAREAEASESGAEGGKAVEYDAAKAYEDRTVRCDMCGKGVHGAQGDVWAFVGLCCALWHSRQPATRCGCG